MGRDLREETALGELAELPGGWAWTRVGEVGRVQLGRQRAPQHHSGEHMRPYLRAANVFDDRIDTSDVLHMNFTPEEYETYVLNSGDILLNEGQSRELVGRPAMFRNELPGACFQNTLVRFQTWPAVLPEYALQVFRHYMRNGRFQQIAQWTTNIAHLGAARFAGLEFPVPPLAEQRRIVTKIEALTTKSRRAKTALDAIPALLERLRQSVLASAFRGDLTAEWREKNPDVEPAEELLKRIRAERRRRWEEAELAKMRAKGKVAGDDRWKEKYEEPAPVDASTLPELPKGWAWVTWAHLGFCQNGRPFPSSEYASRGIKLLRPGNLHVGGSLEWSTDNTKCLPERWAEENADHIVGGNELVMNLTAQSLKDEFLGRVCLSSPGERCLLNQRLVRLTPLMVSVRFCLWLFKAPLVRAYIDELNTGSLIQHMFTSQVDRFALPIPPATEQIEIVSRIDTMLHAASRSEASMGEGRARLMDMDRAILAKAFRGELVPQDPNDEPASILLERLRAEADQTGKPPHGAARRRAAASPPPAPPDNTHPGKKSPASRRSQAPARSRG